MVENWKLVPEWEGLYEVSDLGRVRSLDRVVVQKARYGMISRLSPGRILKACSDGKGYLHVGFCRGGVMARRSVHSLVLEAFVGLRPEGFIADHKNGVRDCNLPDNLRWVTYRSNARNRHSPRGGNRFVGVDYRPERGVWRAKSTLPNGKSHHIGHYPTEVQALAAYQTFKAAHFDG